MLELAGGGNAVADLLKAAIQLGVAGLFAVMWWYERADRLRSNGVAKRANDYAELLRQMSKQMFLVVERNSEAMTRLREQYERMYVLVVERKKNRGQP